MINAGIFQCAGGGLTPAQRLEKLAAILEQNQQHALDLLVCPELFMSGYAVGDALPALAEPVDGDFAHQIGQLARQYNTAIVYGYPEQAGDSIYNSAACIAPNGELLANHRKLMLPPGFEADYFTAGYSPTLFDLNGLRCAVLVCYDAEYPEAVRAMAQSGAQVVIVPTALVDGWPVVARKVMPTRAFENGVWLMYANHAGAEGPMNYLGESCIVAPDGQDAARAGPEECLIVAKLDPEQVTVCQARLPYLQGHRVLRDKLGMPRAPIVRANRQ